MDAKEIQARFRAAGAHVPNDKAAIRLVDALPTGMVATGYDESELIQFLIDTRSNGSVERLLELKRRRDIQEDRRARKSHIH